jgi:single-strand DNA-binding protein
MNNVTLIGRLTADPEVRIVGEGKIVCNFSLAIDDPYAKEDRADFIRITVFGGQGENCRKYLRKGFLAGVSGRIRSDKYTDAEGVKRYPVDIVAERVQFLQWPDKQAATVKDTVSPEVVPQEVYAVSEVHEDVQGEVA